MNTVKISLAILDPEVNPEIGELIAKIGTNKVAVLHAIPDEKALIISLEALEQLETQQDGEGVPLVSLPVESFDVIDEQVELGEKGTKLFESVMSAYNASQEATSENSGCPLCLLNAHDLFENDTELFKAMSLLDTFIELSTEKQAAIATQLREARRQNPLSELMEALKESSGSVVH